jgi:hypothetical protein
MSIEDNIYQHLEEFSRTIITALEKINKRMSDYISSTNERLDQMEKKIENIESLAIVSKDGLREAVKASKIVEQEKRLREQRLDSSSQITRKEKTLPTSDIKREQQIPSPSPNQSTTQNNRFSTAEAISKPKQKESIDTSQDDLQIKTQSSIESKVPQPKSLQKEKQASPKESKAEKAKKLLSKEKAELQEALDKINNL